MQTLDEAKWAEQERELRQDETGQKFLAILTAWFELAEQLYAETDPVVRQDFSGDDPVPVETLTGAQRRRRPLMHAVRQALTEVENSHGYLSMEWLGQMLLIAMQHWTHGPLMEHALTRIERRLVEQMAAVKMAELQTSAQQDANL